LSDIREYVYFALIPPTFGWFPSWRRDFDARIFPIALRERAGDRITKVDRTTKVVRRKK
jgi:hypothetical protein